MPTYEFEGQLYEFPDDVKEEEAFGFIEQTMAGDEGVSPRPVAYTAEQAANVMLERFRTSEGDEEHEDSEGVQTQAFGVVLDEDGTKYGISQDDYDTEEDFTRDVLEEHYRRVDKRLPGFAEMDEPMQELVMDTTWNAGLGAAKWEGFRTAVLSGDLDAAAFAVLDTANAGGKPNKGLAARRAEAYNRATSGQKIAQVRQKVDGQILYILEDGSVLFEFGKDKGRAKGSKAGTVSLV